MLNQIHIPHGFLFIFFATKFTMSPKFFFWRKSRFLKTNLQIILFCFCNNFKSIAWTQIKNFILFSLVSLKYCYMFSFNFFNNNKKWLIFFSWNHFYEYFCEIESTKKLIIFTSSWHSYNIIWWTYRLLSSEILGLYPIMWCFPGISGNFSIVHQYKVCLAGSVTL